MPKCSDKECVNGIVEIKKDGVLVQKLCAKCEKFERDLEESFDYVVYYRNGRAVGYELLN